MRLHARCMEKVCRTSWQAAGQLMTWPVHTEKRSVLAGHVAQCCTNPRRCKNACQDLQRGWLLTLQRSASVLTNSSSFFRGSIAKGSFSKSGCKLHVPTSHANFLRSYFTCHIPTFRELLHLPTSHANCLRVVSPANFSCQLHLPTSPANFSRVMSPANFSCQFFG